MQTVGLSLITAATGLLCGSIASVVGGAAGGDAEGTAGYMAGGRGCGTDDRRLVGGRAEGRRSVGVDQASVADGQDR